MAKLNVNRLVNKLHFYLLQEEYVKQNALFIDSHYHSNENHYNYNGASRSKFSKAQPSDESLTSSAAPHIHHHSSSSSSATHVHKHSMPTGAKIPMTTTTKHGHSFKDASTLGNDATASDEEQQTEDSDESGQAYGNASSDDNNKTTNAQLTNMQKIRANCRAEELSKLKAKCEYLVRSCIGGLILSMTDQQFKDMEGKYCCYSL